MALHVAVVIEKMPSPAKGGTGMHVTLWSLVESLLLAGCRVSVLLVLEPAERHRFAERREEVAILERQGVTVAVVPADSAQRLPVLVRGLRLVRRTVRPRCTDDYPTMTLTAQTRAILEQWQPDAIVGHPVTAMAAVQRVPVAPRLVIVGNLDHLVPRYRWQATPASAVLPFLLGALRVAASRKQ